jgi:hypothetical protein
MMLAWQNLLPLAFAELWLPAKEIKAIPLVHLSCIDKCRVIIKTTKF